MFGEKTVRLRVATDLPLQPGDKVLIGLSEHALAIGSLGVYVLPLLGLFGGALVGKSIVGSDSATLLGGLSGLLLSFSGLKYFRLLDRQGFHPVILRKID